MLAYSASHEHFDFSLLSIGGCDDFIVHECWCGVSALHTYGLAQCVSVQCWVCVCHSSTVSSKLVCGIGVRNMNVLPSHDAHWTYLLSLTIVPLIFWTCSCSTSTCFIALQFTHTSSHSTDTCSCISHHLLRPFLDFGIIQL